MISGAIATLTSSSEILSELLNGDRLAQTDVFFPDARMVMGHFAVYRNSPQINALAMQIPNYINQLAVTGYSSLDENGMAKVVAAHPEIRWSMARTLTESDDSHGLRTNDGQDIQCYGRPA